MCNINKKCENCGKEFEIEYRMREQKYCSKDCSYEKRKKKKIHTLFCDKCNKEYSIEITEYLFNKGKYKKYCSLKCSNSKTWSDEHKKRLSETCKNSVKVKQANIKIGQDRIKKSILDGKKYTYTKDKNLLLPLKEFTCEYCGEIGLSKKGGNNKQRFHKECWLKISGGIKKGSSRGKSGWYKGYWCDSSYELAYIIYNLEHNNKIERNKIGYEYIYNDKKHLYYPDFRVNDKLVEIKNYKSELTDEKLKSVNEDIEIFYKDTIKPYINYVVDKYSKDFIKLYEI